MNDLIAYCGLDCGKCEARRATLDNDDTLREKVARKWSELNGVEITPSMINCAGCRVDGGRALPIATMGPICVAPDLKRQGYGKRLLDYSLEKVAALGVGAVCFEGNIGFYGKSGFTYARELGIRYAELPEGADDSFFLCRELIPGYLDGVRGEYAPPQEYFICQDDPDGFAAFEAGFPPKEKLKLPGQLFGE